MNREADQFEGLRAYLTGYGRNHHEVLAFVATYPHWPELARQEIERRHAALLTGLPYEEVQAIARRQVSLRKLARQVLAELDKEQRHGKA